MLKNYLVKKSDVIAKWLNILKYFYKFYQLPETNVDILKHLLWNEVNIKWNLATHDLSNYYIFHSHLLANHHSYYSSISQKQKLFVK